MVAATLFLAVFILVTACQPRVRHSHRELSAECQAIIRFTPEGDPVLPRATLTPESVDLVNECIAELGIANVRASSISSIAAGNHK